MATFLVAGHGTFASGVKSTLEILLGSTDKAHFINTYIDDCLPADLVSEFFSKVSDDEKVVMLADFYGGSIAQILQQWLSRPNTYLIAGFNLAVIFELYVMDDNEITGELIEAVVEESKQLLVYVNKKLEEADPGGEGDDFFD